MHTASEMAIFMSMTIFRTRPGAKVPVFTDSEHTSAHNKVMIIDAGGPNAVLVTGSFNFTHAAQYKNAENVLIFRGNQPLAETYLKNWHRHYKHSRPYRPKR